MDEVTSEPIKLENGDETQEVSEENVKNSTNEVRQIEASRTSNLLENDAIEGGSHVTMEVDGINNSTEDDVTNPNEEGHREEETNDAPEKKEKSFNTTNFSAVERSWIIYFLGVARGQAYRNFNDLSIQVYKKLCELLERHGHRVPSQRSVRMMWKLFVDTGTMAKPKGGGRPKLPPELKKKRKRSKRKRDVGERIESTRNESQVATM